MPVLDLSFPQTGSIARISEALQELARDARRLGFRDLADEISAVGIEAAESARSLNILAH